MRVLMVGHEFTISGASTFFFRLARHLMSAGHGVALFPLNPQEGPIRRRYVDAGIPVLQAAVAADFDIALCNTICAAPALLRLAPHMPTIWFVNEAEVALRLLAQNPGWADAFGRAAAIVFNMPFQTDVLRSYLYTLDPARIHVLPQGIDIDPAGLARDRVAPKQRTLRVVQVGTLEPRKRPGDLIQAVACSGLDLECVICGTFFGLDPDAQAIVDADPVRFWILSGLSDEDVLAWVESADMFCLASSSETQALAAYEAAQLGRPLVLSDLACYRDVFRHGHEALLFPAGNVRMLAGCLRMLAADPELGRQLGAAAQRVARRFTNRRFFESLDAVMRRVLQDR